MNKVGGTAVFEGPLIDGRYRDEEDTEENGADGAMARCAMFLDTRQTRTLGNADRESMMLYCTNAAQGSE